MSHIASAISELERQKEIIDTALSALRALEGSSRTVVNNSDGIYLKKGRLSAEGRANIIAAAKKRWAEKPRQKAASKLGRECTGSAGKLSKRVQRVNRAVPTQARIGVSAALRRAYTNANKIGLSIVYGANDTRLNRPVALKMIFDSGNDEDSRKRFLREAQAAARVTHPNICRLYDIGEVDSRPFLVMELLEGESMSECLGRGPMPLAEALQVTLSVLSALAALHRSSIVHRDLKPSNVFLSTQGGKLLDFGLAKPVSPFSGDGQTQSELTGHGVIAGTPRYCPS